MAVLDVQAFMNRMEEDTSFREKIMHEDYLAEVEDILNEEGYFFTQKDLQMVKDEMIRQTSTQDQQDRTEDFFDLPDRSAWIDRIMLCMNREEKNLHS